MNSFFRISIVIIIFMLAFILVANFVDSTNVYEDHTGGNPGPEVQVEDNPTMSLIETITGSDNMASNSLWAIVTIGAGAAAIIVGWLMHSMTPIGLYVYSEVFWTSYWRMTSIFSYGGSPGLAYVDPNFIFIITGLMVFLFIAAIIGMMTGSG